MKKKNLTAIFTAPVLVICLVILFSPLLTAKEKIDKNKILETGEEWKNIYMNYQPDQTLLEKLKKKVDGHLKIDVYLATWCSDSRNNVPVFIKIIDRLEKDHLPVNYYDLQRKASRQVKYFIEDLKVERVPTFIFYHDGKEIGRIVENPGKSLIEDFLEIMF